MSCDFRELEEFRDKILGLSKESSDKFIKQETQKVASMVLAETVKRTPVGDYSGGEYACKGQGQDRTHKGNKQEGMQGGTLRRGWTMSAAKKEGNGYQVDIENQVKYASYVEYGHIKMSKGEVTGFERGHFMLTDGVNVVKTKADKMILNDLNTFLEKEINGN